ncbi:MAG: hypothetical protein J0H82_26435 [Alphaproteobacteria bacterium]|jgi:hypothetical protein|nr:hypothetical protein [Alphaproteobacteria bacterium]
MTTPAEPLDAEKLAYWYLRLNGYLQIENFVVHPGGRGGQRTDADLLGVRFPHRAERLIDDPDDVMADDRETLGLDGRAIDVVIAEVKRGQRCMLNGPWTKPERQNIDRVLAAIGCLPPRSIGPAASALYRTGLYAGDGLRVRLIAFGMSYNTELADRYQQVAQIVWNQVIEFVWKRLRRYLDQKADIHQWDAQGRRLRALAEEARDLEEFRVAVYSDIGWRGPGSGPRADQ